MKTQITNQHSSIVAVQPSTTLHRKNQSATMVKLALFIAMVFAMALPAMAGTCSDGNRCSGQIDLLYVTSSGSTISGSGSTPTVYVSIVGESQSQLGCTLQSGVYFTLPSTQPGYLEQYNLLLQAKTTKTAVTIRAITPSSGCVISYVVAGP
jgi:hypothetical protein